MASCLQRGAKIMRILYIDNRRYGHNADLHIDFISFLHKNKYDRIIPYGDNLKRHFKDAISINRRGVSKQLNKIIAKYKPHAILTYNCNGSSYEVGLDNISLYKWVSDALSKVDIPKFHITTDYCRSGFRQDQADWFKYVGYSAALFRHNESLKYPLDVDKIWFPFSVDSDLYKKYMTKNINKKKEKVGFLGAAHNSSKSIYANRIKAIDYLRKKKLLEITKVIDKKFTRKMLFGPRYVRFLSGNLFGLTCGGTCRYFTAKYLQIPAAYSMLVCADTNGLELFPKDTYIMFDKNNLDDMYSKILYSINNKKETREKIDVLHKFVINNYNHHNRARHLRGIIQKYL
jgi:hypothetical protein